MVPNEPWVALFVGIFGAGGLVSLVKALLDWRNGKAQKESETEVRYLLNREKRIALLERQRDAELRYQAELIRALARAGADIPPRPRD